MEKVEAKAQGIKNRLKSVKPYNTIAEYVWNGFDAGARNIDISYETAEFGNITTLTIEDNGKGIPSSLLVNKFKPVLSSEKREKEVAHTLIHGKNGLGRLTFFHISQSASWFTCYKKDNDLHEYSIVIDEATINNYDPSMETSSNRKKRVQRLLLITFLVFLILSLKIVLFHI